MSLDLVEALSREGRPAEIVNVDAMQLYRGMDIGTAKIPVADRRGIPHHLFDVLDPVEEAAVAWFQPLARTTIDAIHSRGADAILVGGSGLYASSVIFDFQFPPRDDQLRAELEAECETNGVEALVARLRDRAPRIADSVDTRNPRRVVRALEVVLLGGDAQVVLPEEPKLWRTETRIIGVHAERATLVARLDQRVDSMWSHGLVDEVRGLIPKGIEEGKTASRAIGYAQALAQVRGNMTEPEAISQTQALTRRYARRQVSWFKRYANTTWHDSTRGQPDIRRLLSD